MIKKAHRPSLDEKLRADSTRGHPVHGAFHGTGVVVQDDAQEGAVHLKVPVVSDETEFPELVHEEARPVNVSCRSSRLAFPD